jgi:molybdate transport system substrate-binding protein
MGYAMADSLACIALRRLASAVLTAALFVGPATASATDLTVWSGGGMRAAISELGATFEKTSSHKLAMRYGTVAKVAEQVTSGEPVDVAILTNPLFETLLQDGKIAGGTTARLAHVPIAVAVRAGARKPDIGSVEAFRKTLIEAAVITYGDPATGDAAGVHMAHVIEQLGLAAEMKPKTHLITPPAGQSGAQFLTGLFQRGETDIAIAPISVLMESEGGDIVGVLPAELQTSGMTYFAGIPPGSRHMSEAKALIEFLAGPLAKPVYTAKGMDPG